MAKKFTKIQPRHGEVVLHCGHLDVKPHHFFKFEAPVQASRPDGSLLTADWFIQCAHCHRTRPGALDAVRGDAIWQGNEPIITETLKS